MNMFTVVLCGIAALLMPVVAGRGRLSRPALLVDWHCPRRECA